MDEILVSIGDVYKCKDCGAIVVKNFLCRSPDCLDRRYEESLHDTQA